MLIRIVNGNLVEHVCVQCAEENDLATEGQSWVKHGWCFLCGKVPGAKRDTAGRRQDNLRKLLGLTGTEGEER